MFDEIPLTRPETPLLDRIDGPEQLRALTRAELEQLALELRHFLIYTVGQTGGHFGAGLGVVELTIALHHAFDTPRDLLVWDVGHQTYPHKILTGRRERMHSLRQRNGIAPFPVRTESDYDTFGVGHSSTSISAALGMAMAAALQGRTEQRTIAVIGDGAMSGGMAFEALNHAAEVNANLLVILNDNQMSISDYVGGLAKYFARMVSSRPYLSMREGSRRMFSRIPSLWELARRTEEHMKGMVMPGTLFEEMGFNYMGPMDGHDLPGLIHTFENIRDQKGPQFLHLVTTKGKGFGPAEQSPVSGHSLAKIEAKNSVAPSVKKIAYSEVFGDFVCDLAAQDDRLVVITPAMKEGSGLVEFANRFPDRFFDVAIAEQHALTFAAGLATQGIKPVVAIYSTFLQRAYDQLIHDVALQQLDVLLAIDRAGLLEDGPTHSGAFDLSYLRAVPNLLIMAPSNEQDARQMLYTGFLHEGPAAVRYPRGSGPGVKPQPELIPLPIGKALLRRSGVGTAILAFGSMVEPALEVAERLNCSLVDMRFVKPLDEALILQMCEQHRLIVTVEENALMGGAGSAVNEFILAASIEVQVLNLGIDDRFVPQDRPSSMLESCGLSVDGITASIRARLERMQKSSPGAKTQFFKAL